ncbi:hypothetical protein EMPG_15109 [Blastomyces silverae]|uniref:Small-subunit processome Utp12 domain-containing protein n=1 Tax=Blastomyces silverae TaxID=2060906 RepID=A0A0H1BDE9_9EURO|nr:hypothetical protein EMPG_15109 [Blastomyces silverae]
MLRFVANCVDETPHLEFNLRWIEALLSIHGRYFKDHGGQLATELRAVSRVVDGIRDEIKRLVEGNGYALEYLLSKPVLGGKVGKKGWGDEVAVVKKVSDASGDEDMDDAGDGDDGGDGEWMGLD